MTPTMERRPATPGHAQRSPISHWTTVLPEALQPAAGHSPIVVLPSEFAGEPVTACQCKGLLVYVRGAWRHTDACLACHVTPPDDAERCEERHTACTRPEPALCQHGCGDVVALTDRCAWDGAPTSCCSCCSNLDDAPAFNGRDLR